MYPVTQDFLDQMRADKRRVDAQVQIDYTDPFIDQSISVSASDQANVSYPQQIKDSVTAPTHKWASLDGAWTLDGSFHLAPEPEDLTQYQFGWWSAQVADATGAFAAPYPSLTVTHIPRPVHTLRVVGDSARGEYAVDFSIDLYAQDGTLLKSQAVTGNTVIEWSMTLPAPVLDVARQVLTITRWSHPGRQAKILEFFTSIQETYESGDVVEIRLLEEREASQGSLPVGNISANEIAIRLANEGRKFDATNRNSPLWGLLKPNRRIHAWLGIRGDSELWGTGWYAPFDKDLSLAKRDGATVAPLPGYVATLRPGEGKFGGAVAVEEGTTNRVPGNIQAWSNYTVQASTYSIVPVSTPYGYGVRLTGQSAGQVGKTTSGNINLGTSYATASIYFKPNAPNGILKIYWDAKDDAGSRRYGIFASQAINLNAYTPGKWYRLVCTADISPNLFVGGSGFYVWAEGTFDVETAAPQLEAKPFATSFVDGTRRAGALSYAVSITPPFTIAGYFIPQRPSSLAVSTDQPIFGVGDASHFFGLHWGWGDDFGYIDDETGQTRPLNARISFNSGDRIFVALVCDTATTTAYVRRATDPDFIVRQTTSKLATGTYNGILVGNFPYEPALAALFDELLILPYAASAEEIQRLYAQTRQLYDEWVSLGTFWSLDWDSPDDTLEAVVRARDRLELLRKSTYVPGSVQQNVSLYTLAEQVLQDAGLPPEAYWIDPALQQIVVPWAWLQPTTHREALRIIAEAALAVVYADRDGVIRIEAMGSVPTTPALQITADDYFPPLQAPSRQDQVANEIVVSTQPLRPAATAQEVYRSTTPISVPAGQTVTVRVQYNQPPVIEAVAALDTPPAGVSITSATYYAWGAMLSISNTSASAANVTLVVTGRPLSVQAGEQVIARDQTSITENGVLRYEFPSNPLVQTVQQAQAIANALLASAKDPRRDIEVEWRGNPALELGDRVTVVGQDVHVIRQEITWAGALSARLTGRKVT